MRPTLKWALGATIGLSLIAVLVPKDVAPLVAASAPSAPQPWGGYSSRPSQVPGGAALPLPAVLPELTIEPAQADPFEAVRGPQPKVPPAPQPAPAPAPAPTPLPPVVTPAQAPKLRYLGSLQAPNGQSMVFVARGASDQSMAVQVGTRLDEGYVVKSIGRGGITLAHAASGTEWNVPMPESAVGLP